MAVDSKVAESAGTGSHDKRETNRNEPVFAEEMEAESVPDRDVPSISSRMRAAPASERGRFQCVCVWIMLARGYYARMRTSR